MTLLAVGDGFVNLDFLVTADPEPRDGAPDALVLTMTTGEQLEVEGEEQVARVRRLLTLLAVRPFEPRGDDQ